VSGQCPSCGAVQSQAWLCSDCCAAIETMLAAAPALIEQLGIAISKQAKIGGGGKAGKGSVHERSPINFGALAVRDALLVELALWGDDINVIRRHVQAADIASGIGKAVKNAYRAIDRMADRKYLGKCNHKVGGLNCPEELWVRPNARDVRCKSCQYEHNVADRRWTCWRWRRIRSAPRARHPDTWVRSAASRSDTSGSATTSTASASRYTHQPMVSRGCASVICSTSSATTRRDTMCVRVDRPSLSL
jgi:hypothetical protein